MRTFTTLFKTLSLSITLLLSVSSQAGVIFGDKWGDPALGTPGGEVTWSLMASGFDCDSGFEPSPCTTTHLAEFMPTGFISEIESAFNTWASIADITFRMIADTSISFNGPSDADIRITGHQMDGPNGELAHAYYPEGFNLSGDIHFDTTDTWGINTAGTFDIFSVALHEIGHAIGLEHSNVSGAVMNANYGGTVQGLQADDIATAQLIYGPAQIQVSVPEPSSMVLFMSMIGLLLVKRRKS